MKKTFTVCMMFLVMLVALSGCIFDNTKEVKATIDSYFDCFEHLEFLGNLDLYESSEEEIDAAFEELDNAIEEAKKYYAVGLNFDLTISGEDDQYSAEEYVDYLGYFCLGSDVFDGIVEKVTKIDKNTAIVTGKWIITSDSMVIAADFEYKVVNTNGKWLIAEATETWDVEWTF